MNNGSFKTGDSIDKDELLFVPEGVTGYTIDRTSDEGISFEAIIVWEDERLRNRIVELLNKYGEKD